VLLLAAMLSGGTVQATAAQKLEDAIDRFASLWARGDANAIAALAAHDGISLDLNGKPMGPLGARQVSALLRRLFDERETIAVRPMVTQMVGGDSARAFGEISWMMRSRGTTIPEKTSVFVALARVGNRWRITEIRFVQR
jgi:ketosteroid isomerase-like protein